MDTHIFFYLKLYMFRYPSWHFILSHLMICLCQKKFKKKMSCCVFAVERHKIKTAALSALVKKRDDLLD